MLYKLADELYETEQVDSVGLTIDFFSMHVAEAKSHGLTHWGTVTDKDVTPWLTKIIFYKK